MIGADTARCNGRHRAWREHVPKDVEIPIVAPGSVDLRPREFAKLYCGNPLGKKTSHKGSGRCGLHLGNNHGKGRLHPAFKTGEYAKAAFERLGDDATKELYSRLYTDAELLSLRGHIAKLGTIMIEIEDEARAGQCPENWQSVKYAARAILEKAMEAGPRAAEALDVAGLARTFAEIETAAQKIADAGESALTREWARQQTVQLMDKYAKLVKEERERLIALMAMLPQEEVANLQETVVAALIAAAEETVTDQAEREDLLANLADRLRLHETVARRRLLGIAAA